VDGQQLYERIQALVDGELSAEDEAETRALIERDPQAAEVYQGLRALAELVRRAAGVALPAALARKVGEDLDARVESAAVAGDGSRLRTFALPAAAALLLGVLLVFLSSLITGTARSYAHGDVVRGCIAVFRDLSRVHARSGSDVPTRAIRDRAVELCALRFLDGVPRFADTVFCGIDPFECPVLRTTGVRIDYACNRGDPNEDARRGLVSVFVVRASDVHIDDSMRESLGQGHACKCFGPELTSDNGGLSVFCQLRGDLLIHVVGEVDAGRLAESIYFCTR